MIYRGLMTLALAFVASASPAQPTPPVPTAAAAAPSPLFLLLYTQGPAWIEGLPMHEQKLGEHVAYMRKLIADGRVVAGGPFGGENGGMAILRAGSDGEAREVAAKDPAVLNGTFVASIKPWTPFLDSGQPLRR